MHGLSQLTKQCRNRADLLQVVFYKICFICLSQLLLTWAPPVGSLQAAKASTTQPGQPSGAVYDLVKEDPTAPKEDSEISSLSSDSEDRRKRKRKAKKAKKASKKSKRQAASSDSDSDGKKQRRKKSKKVRPQPNISASTFAQLMREAPNHGHP